LEKAHLLGLDGSEGRPVGRAA